MSIFLPIAVLRQAGKSWHISNMKETFELEFFSYASNEFAVPISTT